MRAWNTDTCGPCRVVLARVHATKVHQSMGDVRAVTHGRPAVRWARGRRRPVGGHAEDNRRQSGGGAGAEEDAWHRRRVLSYFYGDDSVRWVSRCA
jgi:hypothetical protein